MADGGWFFCGAVAGEAVQCGLFLDEVGGRIRSGKRWLPERNRGWALDGYAKLGFWAFWRGGWIVVTMAGREARVWENEFDEF